MEALNQLNYKSCAEDIKNINTSIEANLQGLETNQKIIKFMPLIFGVLILLPLCGAAVAAFYGSVILTASLLVVTLVICVIAYKAFGQFSKIHDQINHDQFTMHQIFEEVIAEDGPYAHKLQQKLDFLLDNQARCRGNLKLDVTLGMDTDQFFHCLIGKLKNPIAKGLVANFLIDKKHSVVCKSYVELDEIYKQILKYEETIAAQSELTDEQDPKQLRMTVIDAISESIKKQIEKASTLSEGYPKPIKIEDYPKIMDSFEALHSFEPSLKEWQESIDKMEADFPHFQNIQNIPMFDILKIASAGTYAE